MEICKKNNEVSDFKAGNLYQNHGDLYMYIAIRSGKMLIRLNGTLSILHPTRNNWTDVTDKYCLQEK